MLLEGICVVNILVPTKPIKSNKTAKILYYNSVLQADSTMNKEIKKIAKLELVSIKTITTSAIITKVVMILKRKYRYIHL